MTYRAICMMSTVRGGIDSLVHYHPLGIHLRSGYLALVGPWYQENRCL